jgi:hypothetical protein
MAKKKQQLGFDYGDYLGYQKYSKQDFGLFDMDDYSSYNSRRSGASNSGHMDIVYPDMSYSMEQKILKEVDMVNSKQNKQINSAKQFNDWTKMPDFMPRDIFKMYYNKNVKYKMGKENYWWKNLLGSLDNYMMKISTNDSYMNSAILTKHMAKALMEMMEKDPDWKDKMDKLNQQLKDQADKSKQDGQPQPGEGGGEGQQGEQDGAKGQDQKESGKGGSGAGSGQPKMQDAIDSLNGLKQGLDKALSDAQKEMADAQDKVNQMGGLDPHKSMEDLDMVNMLLESCGSNSLSVRAISKFVKKTIKGFKSALTGDVAQFEESLFDSEDISDIVDMELMPFDALLEDVNVKTSKASIKFDLYIDASGSMGSEVGMGNGQNINRMTLAKILAYQMNRFNILNDVYTFTSRPVKRKKEDILKFTASGGTKIDECILNVKETKIPSVILSDGDDTVNEYDERCYFLCIANGIQYLTDESKKYCDKSKMVLYNNGKMMRGTYQLGMFDTSKEAKKGRDYIEYVNNF